MNVTNPASRREFLFILTFFPLSLRLIQISFLRTFFINAMNYFNTLSCVLIVGLQLDRYPQEHLRVAVLDLRDAPPRLLRLRRRNRI